MPEPELALVMNPAMEIVGYMIGNDMSSRYIEREMTYLPRSPRFLHTLLRPWLVPRAAAVP